MSNLTSMTDKEKINDVARILRNAPKDELIIDKIKLVRACTGLGLKDAMDLVKGTE